MSIMMPPPDALAQLRVNPDWASLPLFDRTGWTRVRFGDVVENCNETCDPVEAGLDRFIAMEHLEPGSLHVQSWGNVADGTTFTRRCRPGQVLFGRRRAYQRKVAVAEFEAVVSGDIYVLAPKDANRLLPELLPFICLSERFFQHAVGTSAGSLSPRTKWDSLASFEFELPPLDQQRRLAHVLQAADEVVSATDRAAANATAALEAELRNFLYAGDSWPIANCEDLLAEGPRNGFSPPASATAGRVATLSISAIRGGKVVTEGSLKFADVSDESVRQFRLCPNDILVVRGNGNRKLCGRAGIVSGVPEGCFYPDLLIRLRFRGDRLLPEFVVLHWNEQVTHGRLLNKAKSSNGIWKINGQDIRAHELMVPPLAAQTRLLQKLNEKRVLQTALERASLNTSLCQAALLNTIFS